MRVLVFLLVLGLAAAARADEGMWTFDQFPAAKMKAAYGWAPDRAWLDHVRLSSLAVAGGCSASFISPDGLVMTNHHCARECIEAQGDQQHDYITDGFYAAALSDERKCPGYELDGLQSITNVTARIAAATKGKSGKAFADAQAAAIAKVEGECATGAAVLCSVVTLYDGGIYDLYKYNRYQDVRLVLSVEDDAANFGGDPDNFEYPRYDIDVAFLRVYVNGRPLHPADYLRFARIPAKAGDVVLTSGNPEATDRDDTVAELEFMRDYDHPIILRYVSEQVGILWEMQHDGAQMQRESLTDYFFAMNTLKALQGEEAALVGGTVMANARAREAALRQRVGNPAPWDAIAAAKLHEQGIFERYFLLETFPAFMLPDDVRQADELMRYGAETQKPDGARLEDYTAANLPGTQADITAASKDYPELDRKLLAWWLSDMRFYLGADDPDVKAILGKDSPERIADEIVDGTKMRDAAARAKLLAAGPAAIAASDDPMLVFLRRLDGPARRVLADEKENVDAVVTKNAALIADDRFRLYGTSEAPDGTLTPRLSYGTVKGYEQDGKFIAPFTDFAGAFGRATGEEPFKLPPRWIAARNAGLDTGTQLDMVTTDDIVGGNSGSPVVDEHGDLTGLIFDGDIQSLGGSFGFDPAVNRAVAVDATALKAALTKIYQADRLVKEIGF